MCCSRRGVSPTTSITTVLVMTSSSRPGRRAGRASTRARAPSLRRVGVVVARRGREHGPGVGLDLEMVRHGQPGRRRGARASRSGRPASCVRVVWTGTWKWTRHSVPPGRPPASASGRSSTPATLAVRALAHLVQEARLRERAEQLATRLRARLVDAQRAGHLRLHDRHAGVEHRSSDAVRILELDRQVAGVEAHPDPLGREPGEEAGRLLRRSRRCSRAPARAPSRMHLPVSPRSSASPSATCSSAARARRASRSPQPSRQPSGSVEMLPSSTSSGSRRASSRAERERVRAALGLRPVGPVDVALDDRRVEGAVREAVQRDDLEPERVRAARASRSVGRRRRASAGAAQPEADAEHAARRARSARGAGVALELLETPSRSSAGCTFEQ